MKTKFSAAVIALILTPGFAFAQCGHDRQASSCKEGYKWDQATATCVLNPST